MSDSRDSFFREAHRPVILAVERNALRLLSVVLGTADVEVVLVGLGRPAIKRSLSALRSYMRKKEYLQWHPAYAAAMELELGRKEELSYERERNLSRKPLAVDLLICKEKEEKKLDSEIGEFFRRKNVLEYKSPGDAMGAEAFYKATAYACLYKATESAEEGIWAEDVTVTLYRQGRPGKLLRFLKRKGISIKNPHPGIYRAEEGLTFPTQIVVGKELDWEKHPWVKAITGKLTEEELQGIVELAAGLREKRERDLADAVLQVCARANMETMRKLKEGEGKMCQALMELMEPELRQSRELGREAGRNEERMNTLKEKERADGEKKRADGEKKRADQAEKEVRELRAILRRAGISGDFGET